MTQFEKREILKYSNVYYYGNEKSKEIRRIQGVIHKKANNGFDMEGGFYKVVEGDHIAYRYEVL